MSGLQRTILVLRKSVEGLDALPDADVERRLTEYERQLGEVPADRRWEMEYAIQRCRMALEPDFEHQAYHDHGCYVLDMPGITRHVLRVPLTEVPHDAWPCQICSPPLPKVHISRNGPKPSVPPPDPDAVGIGSIVEVINEAGGRLQFEIGTSSDDRASSVSTRSPVGQALLGKRAGLTVKVLAPRGTTQLQIIAVTQP